MELYTQPAQTRTSPAEIVEIKLWEIYLLYHPAQLYKILADYSVDHGPAEHDQQIGRIVFRFTLDDWSSYIKELLYQYRIPVVIQSNPLHALRVKGRQAVIR